MNYLSVSSTSCGSHRDTSLPIRLAENPRDCLILDSSSSLSPCAEQIVFSIYSLHFLFLQLLPALLFLAWILQKPLSHFYFTLEYSWYTMLLVSGVHFILIQLHTNIYLFFSNTIASWCFVAQGRTTSPDFKTPYSPIFLPGFCVPIDKRWKEKARGSGRDSGCKK